MVGEYLRDHGQTQSAELREPLGLGDSASAQVEASRYLKKWSQDDAFLVRQGNVKLTTYILRSDA
jgi:ATP-dependent DNA helicase RecG